MQTFDEYKFFAEGMEGCHQLYAKELEQFYSERKSLRFGFSKSESWLPLLSVAAYVAIGLGILGIKLANT